MASKQRWTCLFLYTVCLFLFSMPHPPGGHSRLGGVPVFYNLCLFHLRNQPHPSGVASTLEVLSLIHILFSTEQGLVLHWPSILLFGIMLTAMNLPKLKELPSVFFIAVAAVVGIVFQMVD